MKLVDILPPGAVSVDLTAKRKKRCWRNLCGLLGKAGQVARSRRHGADPPGTGGPRFHRHRGGGGHPPRQSGRPQSPGGGAWGFPSGASDFEALDGEPVHIVFLLVAPPDAAGNHLKALAKVSRLLKDKFFRQALKDAKSPDEILKIIREEDEY